MCDADVDNNGFEQDGLTAGNGSCDSTPPISCASGAGADCDNSLHCDRFRKSMY
jgi:hypothetical protein